tara:strand:+ start:1036 stop:1542 length:507 start_codon:yes stop_codon:yes gene_type:complete
MKPGNKFTFQTILFIFLINNIFAQDQITTSPLINLDQIEPSFEESNEKKEDFKKNKTLKTKKQKNLSLSSPHAVLMGLDKITAKSSKIVVNINEIEKFGPLEIKILKCGIIEENNKQNNVAYMQVKDLTKTENEKVFIFNGWTFSSNPSMTPFDHAIYDLQLLSCNNV